jgi:dolichyl-phosphate-mannose--protein O-mannosyl transferase
MDALKENSMMNRSRFAIIATAVTLAIASSAMAQHTAQAERLPHTTGWSALLALTGVLLLVCAVVVMTRRRFRAVEVL